MKSMKIYMAGTNDFVILRSDLKWVIRAPQCEAQNSARYMHPHSNPAVWDLLLSYRASERIVGQRG